MSIGRTTYFSHVRDMTVESPTVELVPVVCEFPDIFLIDLPGLPLERDVDFALEGEPDTKPISILPYRMAPTEFKELSTQLRRLQDLGFIWPSVSTWGALVLFVKKETRVSQNVY